MPPKNSTDKITKSKATPKKGRASNNASPAKADTKANQNLLFLWSCLQSTHTKVDIKEVSEEWGLNPSATRMRFQRLGAYIDKLQKAEQAEKDASASEAQQGEDEYEHHQENETEAAAETSSLKDHLLADSAFALEG